MPSASVYLENFDINWTKVWKMELDGNQTTVTWGNKGSTTKTSTRTHKDDAAAQKFFEKAVAVKRKASYKEPDSEPASTEAAAPQPPAPASGGNKRTAEEADDCGADGTARNDEPPAKKAKTEAATPATQPAPTAAAAGDATDAAPRNSENVVDNWIVDEERGLMVLPGDVKGGAKVAGFDMDDTIITTESGRTFAVDEKDWKFLNDDVPRLLKDLRSKGYKIVIFTNQAGIGTGSKFDAKKAGGIKRKIIAVSRALGFSVQAFACCGYGRYRKPAPGLWELMEDEYNGGVAVDRAKSMYVGDAAGRGIMTMAGRKKDFSCGDRKFAVNLKVAFHTPEELFLGKTPAAFEWGTAWNPRADPFPATPTADERSEFHKPSQEVVLNVGFPASGKSSFSKRHLVPHGYVQISRDMLGTPAKCEKALKEALAHGKSAVIDNTSPSKSARAAYIKIAKAAKVPVRCHHFVATMAQAQHLNTLRDILTEGDKKERVPTIAFNMFKKNYEAPDTKEGFAEVVDIRFVGAFENDTHKELYFSFLQP